MGPEFLLQFREIMDSIEANDQLEVVVFESAMAYAMMGGLLIATVLTLPSWCRFQCQIPLFHLLRRPRVGAALAAE
jgi:hypothetical protein